MSGLLLKFHPWETEFPTGQPKKYVGKFSYENVIYDMMEISFNYKSNPAIGFGWCCFPRAECLGYHEGDNESVFILYDEGTGTPRFVYFKAHGRGQGLWKPYEECEIEDGTLVAYVARGSHAFYPSPAIWWRAFIFAPDLTSNNGIKTVYKFPEENSGPITKDIPETSITFCLRCCLCCCMDKIRGEEERRRLVSRK